MEKTSLAHENTLSKNHKSKFKSKSIFYPKIVDFSQYSNDGEEFLMNFLISLDENREEILIDFFIKYLVFINNISKKSPPVKINGRFINKLYLKFCDDLGITLPISRGSDPAYNPLLFSKLGELEEVCGFHPGIDLYHSISVDKDILSKFSEEIKKIEKIVHIILQYHFVNCMGLKGLKDTIHDMVWNKTEADVNQFARDVVDQKMIRELLDNMKLDYTNHRIHEKIKSNSINPNTKNIIEEIDNILSGNSVKKYMDHVDLERELQNIFRNHKKKPSSGKKSNGVSVGKSHHGPSCEMNNGGYEYLLNLEYLEAVKEQDGTEKIITYKGKRYLVFRGTCMRSFLGVRLDPREEYRFSHTHYYFLELEKGDCHEIEKIVKKLEKYLYGVVAKRFLISDSIRDNLEQNEKKVLKRRYIKHYELLKEIMKEPEHVNLDLVHCDPIPAYGGLILAALSISSKPNIPLTRERIQSYLGQIEVETLLSWGDPETIEAVHSFENCLSFKNLYKDLSTLYFKGESLVKRLRYLRSGLTELLPTGHISENIRPLQIKTLLQEKKSNCEGYVLLIGFLFHLWQDIFPELQKATIRFYLFRNETLNNVIGRTEFKEPHMFVTVKIDDELEVIDPTNMISNEKVRRKKGIEQLLQEKGYWKSYKIREIGRKNDE